MIVDRHRAKAENIERSLARCSLGDYEMIIEGAMLAGTHWFNIVLHRSGLSPPDRDAMHAEFLSLGERRKVLVLVPEALHALDEIERFRTLHVRGDMPGGERAAERALECLSLLRIRALAGALVAGARAQAAPLKDRSGTAPPP